MSLVFILLSFLFGLVIGFVVGYLYAIKTICAEVDEAIAECERQIYNLRYHINSGEQ